MKAATGAQAPARRVVEVIHEYVGRTRAWDRGQYRIEEKGNEGGLEVYWVAHSDDEKLRRPGGGKSFAVHYDPWRQVVAKELAFQ